MCDSGYSFSIFWLISSKVSILCEERILRTISGAELMSQGTNSSHVENKKDAEKRWNKKHIISDTLSFYPILLITSSRGKDAFSRLLTKR